MRSFIVRRIIYGAIVILLVSFLIFALSRMAGDPRDLYVDEYTTGESYAAMGRAMGLDKPLVLQYLIWIGKALTEILAGPCSIEPRRWASLPNVSLPHFS